MNINCVICSDLFLSADSIFTTPCGHIFHHVCLMQWMERSKSCPQCRNKCTDRNIFRIYFNNIANLDSTGNTANLLESIDNMTLQVREKDQALKAAQDEKTKLEESLKTKEKKIEKLDVTVSRHHQIIATMRHEMDILASNRATFKALETENTELKSKLNLMTSIESVLTASQREVDEILRQNLSSRDLAVMVGTLRRELNSNEIRKSEMRKQMQALKNDVRGEQEERRKIQDKLSFYESENHTLKNRLRRLEQTDTDGLTEVDLIDLVETPELAKRPRLALKHLGDLNTPSPLSNEEFQSRVAQVRESDSPYLKVKSSSIALACVLKKPMAMKQAHASSAFAKPKDGISKMSIFTKPRLAVPSQLTSENLVYNGIGGTTKVLQSDLKKSNPIDDFPHMSKPVIVVRKKKLAPLNLK